MSTPLGKTLLLAVAMPLALSWACSAQDLTFDAPRLKRLEVAMQSYVDQGKVVGAVSLVMQHGRVVHRGSWGWADREAKRPMSAGTIFRIASQTKAVTSVAVMMLFEEGKLALNDPVSTYLPSFARASVAIKSDTGLALVPVRRPITIRDLLTHTAGISYGTDSLVSSLYRAKGLGPAAGYGWYTADKDEPICDTMDRLGTLPFVAQPGERYVYGYNTDVLGCVVERVSGLPLDQFFATKIFGPLGMRDTHFFLPEAKRDRLATVYGRDPSGALTRLEGGPKGQGDYVDGPRKSFAGGAGLLSTADDYARFLEMLRRKGELDGVRLLGPATVELMTSNQVGTLFSAEGLGFSLGFQTTERAGAGGSPRARGSFGWGGAYATSYWVDPAHGLVAVLMTQHLPNVLDTGTRFADLLYQALVPARKRKAA